MRSVVPFRRCLLPVLIAACLATTAAEPATAATPSFAGTPVQANGLTLPAKVQDGSLALARGGAFERRFWPGVNLGSTIPGHQPGEVAASRADYDRWLKGMGELGVRVVRVYTILRPAFYDALAAYNAAHPQDPLHFIQGVWLPGEERWYETGDIYDATVTQSFREEIEHAVGVVHGDATLPQRPGHAGGTYKSNVSQWLLAWSPGIEWDPGSVESTNAKNGDAPRFAGRYISATPDANPMENWLATQLDHLATLDAQRGWSRPITFTNWVTADPLKHPDEPFADEDKITVDATHVQASADWPAGFFASYHAYPYYPDFLGLQANYLGYRRARDGKVDPYAGYLNELRRYHGSQAVMITELGVPSGPGAAHRGPLGRDQGDHSEQEQGAIDADLMRDVADEGYAGALLFEWTDEWFKQTWNTQDFEQPRDRRQLWRNVLTNEKQFGLVSTEPGKKTTVVTVDGSAAEWKKNGSKKLLAKKSGDVREVSAVADAAYVHLLVKRSSASKGVTFGFDVRPGKGGGLPGTRKLDPAADVAVMLGPGRKATIVRAGYTDPTVWQFGVAQQLFPFDAGDNEEGSGKWFVPTLALSRGFRVPSTGAVHDPEFLGLGNLKWGTADPNSKKVDVRTMAAGNGKLVELRIPWSLLGFSDPSSRLVFVPKADGTFGTQAVKSIGLSAVPAGGKLVRGKRLKLSSWNRLDWHERKKAGWPVLETTFAQLSSR
jgi:hypothetical protein